MNSGVSVRGTCGHPMECPTVLWDHGMGWTVGHTRICRGTGGHPMECPTVPWDCGMRWTIPLSRGTMGWDGRWDTHTSVEGQVDIPWNVPLSHGTVGWAVGHTRICRGTGGHPMECPTVPWDCGMGWTIYGISGHL